METFFKESGRLFHRISDLYEFLQISYRFQHQSIYRFLFPLGVANYAKNGINGHILSSLSRQVSKKGGFECFLTQGHAGRGHAQVENGEFSILSMILIESIKGNAWL